MYGIRRIGWCALGLALALPLVGNSWGAEGDAGTREDAETRRRGDAETSDSPRLRVTVSPRPDRLRHFSPPSSRTWRRWWRSRRRPPAVRHTFMLNRRPVELVVEALPTGWQHPCTAAELEATLRELPAAWTARLTSVRLTYCPEWGAHARTDRSRIEISYIVDEALRPPGPVIGEAPEELQFGARIEGLGRARHFVWPDPKSARVYVLRHILIHELGHHVAPPGLRYDEEEAWAEAFAFRYFTPSPTGLPSAAGHGNVKERLSISQ